MVTARAPLTNLSLIVADESRVHARRIAAHVGRHCCSANLKEQQQVSILYITHDLATAYYFAADRIANMLRGWIVEEGPVEKARPLLHPIPRTWRIDPPGDPDHAWFSEVDLAILDTDEYTLKAMPLRRSPPASSRRLPPYRAAKRDCLVSTVKRLYTEEHAADAAPVHEFSRRFLQPLTATRLLIAASRFGARLPVGNKMSTPTLTMMERTTC